GAVGSQGSSDVGVGLARTQDRVSCRVHQRRQQEDAQPDAQRVQARKGERQYERDERYDEEGLPDGNSEVRLVDVLVAQVGELMAEDCPSNLRVREKPGDQAS